MTMLSIRKLDGRFDSGVSGDKYTELVPGKRPSQYDRCHVTIYVAKDYSQVLMGGGEYGFDGIVHELDAVAVDALAERFRLPELVRAADVMSMSRFQRVRALIFARFKGLMGSR